MRRIVLFLSAMALALGSCAGGDSDRFVLAAGTTLVDSGFIEMVVESYTQETEGAEIAVVALGSAEALAYADAGNADVTITHEPDALAAFLSAHPQAASFVPFASEFTLVGPPAFSGNDATVVDAFARVVSSGFPFISRDDGSGTYAQEQSIWASIPYAPAGQGWYTRTGSGMASTLLVASQRSAVTLAELGAFLTVSAQLSLVEIPVEEGTLLENPYDLTVVDSSNRAAVAFGEWLAAPDGVAAISAANERLFGIQVYRVP